MAHTLARCLLVATLQVVVAEVLPPLDGKSGPERLLLFVPGGAVPLKHYLETVQVIQQQASTRLWVSLISCPALLCVPDDHTKELVTEGIQKAVDSGFPSTSTHDVIIAGHSLGAVASVSYVANKEGDFAGLMVFGVLQQDSKEGYPTDLAAFNTSFLSMQGELDFVPFTQAATIYHQMQQLPSQDKKSVVIIPKMDHSNFCPGFNVSDDIIREMSDSEALGIIGSVAGTWVDHVAGLAVSQDRNLAYRKRIADSFPLLQPFNIAVTEASNRCIEAQLVMSGLQPTEYGKLEVTTEFPDSLTVFSEKHIKTVVLPNKTVSVETVTFVTEAPALTSFVYAPGPSEVNCKLASAAHVQELLNTTGTNTTCMEVNRAAVQRAKDLMRQYWPSALQRYEKIGNRIVLQADVATKTGFGFIYEQNLKWHKNTNELDVASPTLQTRKVHYCKLAPVSKFIEWMSTVGISTRYPRHL